MYSEDSIVNDIVLTLVNDGNGSECGMTYAERVAAADTGIGDYRIACAKYNERRAAVYEMPKATRRQVVQAATLVQAYYRNHAKELT
jgi:hypothetical protein